MLLWILSIILFFFRHTVNLGKPSPRYPPTPLEDDRGVVLHYIEGDFCDSDTGERYNSTVILICNRNIHVVRVVCVRAVLTRPLS